LNAKGITFGYRQDNLLIKNFDISIGSRDRIAIIGKNGKGKTTLLKLLAGSLDLISGKINENNNVEKAIYEQTNISSLDKDKTIEEEILYSHEDIDKQKARDAAGAMMFEGDAALKKIGVLSGGERSRVMLAKIIATPCNLLMLDEPTNHLDMESCDALLEAINEFKGAVLIVTHNEMFLHSIANRLIIFQGGDVYLFEGTYAEFLEKEGWEEEDFTNGKNKISLSISKKGLRKKRSEIIAEKSKILKPLENKIFEIENEIEIFEKELNNFNMELIRLSKGNDFGKITEVSNRVNTIEKKIEELFNDLEILTEEFEIKKAEFEKRLQFL
jgi:ATP-binding cassette subfamily F protein 3